MSDSRENPMTTYLLTTGDDTITGTSSADTFDETVNGEFGGIDNLSGGGGNDTFQLLDGDQDFVDGGSGVDTLIYLTDYLT
jgi:Ca2+-binding RTX toxin-like protein